MSIEKGKVVSIDYKLTNDRAEVVDSSEGREPLAYLHGVGQILPKLEEQLEGRSKGDSLQVTIGAADGYGLRDDARIVKVPRDAIQGDGELVVGTMLQASGPDGNPQTVTVTGIEGDEVTIDGNHPLAGENLNFDVTVRDVRDATEEEISHGHVHGPGGHQH